MYDAMISGIISVVQHTGSLINVVASEQGG